MVVASVEIIRSSVDLDHVFLEGDIMRNKVFLGYILI